MPQEDEPQILPLWLNGRAYLAIPAAFHEVSHAQTGEVLRRTPLCDSHEWQQAIAAARSAQTSWTALAPLARATQLAQLADALTQYAEHFSALLVEEAGLELDGAQREIAGVISLLQDPVPRNESEAKVALVSGASFHALLLLAIPWVNAGGTLVLCPPPQTPSAILALAELASRCSFPDGVINVLYCEKNSLDSLSVSEGVCLLRS